MKKDILGKAINIAYLILIVFIIGYLIGANKQTTQTMDTYSSQCYEVTDSNSKIYKVCPVDDDYSVVEESK